MGITISYEYPDISAGKVCVREGPLFIWVVHFCNIFVMNNISNLGLDVSQKGKWSLSISLSSKPVC